jgi:GNAT superfamily N-acetyltransferase
VTELDDSGIGRYSAEVVRAMKAELVAVHLDARAELLDQAFYSAERFAQRFEEHIADPGFELVTCREAGLLIGYAYGGCLPADTWFWSRLDGVDDPELSRETGSRTFWLRELLVRKTFQRLGYARRLHDALLAGRQEERAALFVRSDNPARLLYRKWGWSVVGHLPPQLDSPQFEAMILGLRNAGGSLTPINI